MGATDSAAKVPAGSSTILATGAVLASATGATTGSVPDSTGAAIDSSPVSATGAATGSVIGSLTGASAVTAGAGSAAMAAADPARNVSVTGGGGARLALRRRGLRLSGSGARRDHREGPGRRVRAATPVMEAAARGRADATGRCRGRTPGVRRGSRTRCRRSRSCSGPTRGRRRHRRSGPAPAPWCRDRGAGASHCPPTQLVPPPQS